MLSKEQASRLWNDLRGNLLATQDTIKKIIDERAWEPLGYASFTQAWEDYLKDIQLSKAVEAVVVYGMLADGSSKKEISDAIYGVGIKTVEEYYEAREAGLDPEEASVHLKAMAEHSRLKGGIVVQAHTRSTPHARGEIKIKGLDVADIAIWKAIAAKRGIKASDWFTSVFVNAMSEEIKNER